MVANDDPRIDALFVPTAGGIHKGSLQGDFAVIGADSDGNGTDDDKEDYSTVEFDETSDIPLMSTWEVNFYLAEVYARAGDAMAKTYYDAAIQASMEFWGIEGEITGSEGYAVWKGGTVEENIKQIAMQKWVSYCKVQHIEAVFERNRTKYPAVNSIEIKNDANRTAVYLNFPVGDFTISVAGLGKLSGNVPSSPTYPNAVITRNTTKPSQKTDVGQKVWWDQKAGK